MDGSSLFDNSPGAYVDGCLSYKLGTNIRKCRNGYTQKKSGICFKKGQHSMYPAVFKSLGYIKQTRKGKTKSPKTRKTSYKKSSTKKVSPKSKRSTKTRKLSPKGSSSPKTLQIQMMDGSTTSLPSHVTTIGAAKKQIQLTNGIPITDQQIYSETSETPLENTTRIISTLGTLMMVVRVSTPDEFKNLEEDHAVMIGAPRLQFINDKRKILRLLLDHKEDGVTITQILTLLADATTDDVVIIMNVIPNLWQKELITISPNITKVATLLNYFDGTEYTIKLNRNHPYIATLF